MDRRAEHHLERAQRLRGRIVQLARDARALVVAGADDLRRELARARAVGGEMVEQIVERAADAREVAVGERRRQ